jgi:hypothetical protein
LSTPDGAERPGPPHHQDRPAPPGRSRRRPSWSTSPERSPSATSPTPTSRSRCQGRTSRTTSASSWPAASALQHHTGAGRSQRQPGTPLKLRRQQEHTRADAPAAEEAVRGHR